MSVASLGLSSAAQGGINLRSTAGSGVLLDTVVNFPSFTSSITQTPVIGSWPTGPAQTVVSTFKTGGGLANVFTLAGTLNFTPTGSGAPTVSFYLTTSPGGIAVSTSNTHVITLNVNNPTAISLTTNSVLPSNLSTIYLCVGNPGAGLTVASTSWTNTPTFSGTWAPIVVTGN